MSDVRCSKEFVGAKLQVYLISKIIVGGAFVIVGIFFAQEVKADYLPAPILLSPNEKTIIGEPKPKIIGLAKSGTEVLVYIDNVYNGKTEFLFHESGTADFAYTPFLNLAVGWHKLEIFTRDESGKRSMGVFSNFYVEPYYPAPTLFQPVVNASTTPDKPFIVGLAKNDSKIQVFIDQVFFGEFEVENHPSDTANFAEQPFVALTNGSHLVYTVAIDKRGKTSKWSNLVSFTVRAPQISAIRIEKKVTDEIGGFQEEIEPIVELPKDKDVLVGPKDFTAIQATSTPGIDVKKIIFVVGILMVLGIVYWYRRTPDI